MVNMLDLPRVFRDAGVEFVEEPGWQTRGTGGPFTAGSVMLHHDASPPGSSSGSADYIIANLLSQLWLSYAGVWHIIAAGRMNHAGKGSWPGVPTDDANATFIGVETDHTTNEQWTAGQRQNGLRGLLALADWLGIRDSLDDLHRHLIAHKEWAPTRKVDPDPLDMDDLRALILDPPDLSGAPVDTVSRSCSTPRNLVAGEWRNLQTADSGEVKWAVGQGPAKWFVLTAALTISGPPGATVQLRPYKNDAGDDDHRTGSYSTRQVELDDTGTAKVDLAQQGSISDDDWLRIEAYTGADDVAVQSIASQLATW